MALELLIKSMKLGRRWLYVLWIASTLVWHQAGSASSSSHPATETAQWAIVPDETTLPASEFTLLGVASLEDQDLTKRANAFTSFIGHFAESHAPTLVATGTSVDDLPPGISATTNAWRLIRGPPARA